eukprot:CAMPEP_0119277216 /NCGR_PEP_ID=MMETSP1329-20130426/16755_1 /TAXON_ID=114041 /ORGANISM="Genus nov. species nov., Strain RCC1024" /LENGTH=249 /DNA_ID=CAMNT_0007277679 /DNA_START=109 /DNA_END=855 /DNA_ORIENTATION=+
MSKKRKAADAMGALVASVTCSITSSLCVCPVVAEDGHTYERAAIERWFEKKLTSPHTNKSIGRTLLDSLTARQQIQALIENGAVDDEAAAVWHLESAKAVIKGKLPGDLRCVSRHLAAADDRHELAETLQLQQAIDVKHQMDVLLSCQGGARDAIAAIFARGREGAAMTEWRELRIDVDRIRVIDDVAELQRLCKRPAPGAELAVNWHPDMAALAGEEFEVDDIITECKAYTVELADVNGSAPGSNEWL